MVDELDHLGVAIRAEVSTFIDRALRDVHRAIPGLSEPAGGRCEDARLPGHDLALLALLAREAHRYGTSTELLARAEAHQRAHCAWCEETGADVAGARRDLSAIIAARGGAGPVGVLHAHAERAIDALTQRYDRRREVAEPHLRDHLRAGGDEQELMQLWRIATGAARPDDWGPLPHGEIAALVRIAVAEAELPVSLRPFVLADAMGAYATQRTPAPSAQRHCTRMHHLLRGLPADGGERMPLHIASSCAQITGALRAMLAAPGLYIFDPRSASAPGPAPVRAAVRARGESFLAWTHQQCRLPGWQGLELRAHDHPGGDGQQVMVTGTVGVQHGRQLLRLVAFVPLGTIRSSDAREVERRARVLLAERGIGDGTRPGYVACEPVREGVVRGDVAAQPCGRRLAASIDAALGGAERCAHPGGDWRAVSVPTPTCHALIGAALDCPTCLRRGVAFVGWHQLGATDRERIIPAAAPGARPWRAPEANELTRLLRYRAHLLSEPVPSAADLRAASQADLDPAAWATHAGAPRAPRAVPSLRRHLWGAS